MDIIPLLQRWARASETYWSTIPGHPEWGVYGTGYNGWGVQTTQKYLAVMAALAHYGADETDVQWCLDRALAALRFNLASHRSGHAACTDNTQWGHTWISALGIERMMFGVHLLQPHFSDADRQALQHMLISEAEWLLTSYQRGPHRDIKAGQWASDGCNDPESNIWNGALLWRTAQMYPDHPHAGDWAERACRFLINGVSIPADATSAAIVDGKPISERYVGPNFFPHYALDHHGYLNVGYMVICVSNAAMLHFDLKAARLARPQSLDHHQSDLWQVLRRFIFSNGRLARIGGDTRVRYAYCQEYLLPALLYAADQLGESHASFLTEQQLMLIQQEAEDAADGSFYGNRLAALKEANPLYYTRLESDRACALGMLLAYGDLMDAAQSSPSTPPHTFEQSVQGNWCEPEHGAALHRSATRFASFSWRAFGLAQGLCLPPHLGHWAEWEHNLAGQVEFVDFPHPHHVTRQLHRRLDSHHVEEFDGGFATSGAVIEGTDITLAESWKGTNSAKHQLAFVALPDQHTVIGLQHCRMSDRRGYVKRVKGLQFNLPNDLYNQYQRDIFTAAGKSTFTSPPTQEERHSLGGKWANIGQQIGLVGLYGADELAIHRHSQRRAGALQSLFVEEICYPCLTQTTPYEAGELILDCAWATLSSVDANATQAFDETHPKVLLETPFPDVRALRVTALNHQTYCIIANFSDTKVLLPATVLLAARWKDMVSGENVASEIAVEAGRVKVLLAG